MINKVKQPRIAASFLDSLMTNTPFFNKSALKNVPQQGIVFLQIKLNNNIPRV